jgi:hypothetical protein
MSSLLRDSFNPAGTSLTTDPFPRTVVLAGSSKCEVSRLPYILVAQLLPFPAAAADAKHNYYPAQAFAVSGVSCGLDLCHQLNRRSATQHGLEIVQTIEITDLSGTAVLRSRGMQELLRLMASPDIHGVVAKEFSRLMRPENFSDYALLQHLIDTRTILYLPDGPLDFASEAGKLLGGIRALIAGQERREMLRRLQDAKEAMRRVGKHPGGSTTLPYAVGYIFQRIRLALHR